MRNVELVSTLASMYLQVGSFLVAMIRPDPDYSGLSVEWKGPRVAYELATGKALIA